MEEVFNILMVDDRPENLLALEAVLDKPEYNLVGVTSGEAALKCLLKKEFALILLDVQMPGLNGFETAKLIRTRGKSRTTPIIFITAISQTEQNVLEGYASGAVDYIFKPLNPEVLRAKVDAFLRLHKCQCEVAKQSEILTSQVEELNRVNEQLTATTLELCRNEILLENMVAERTQRITSILESIKDAFFAIDEEYKFTYVNAAAELILDMPRREILGKTIFEVLNHDVPLVERLIAISQSKESATFETICPLTERWYEVRVYPAVKGLSVYLNDITERRLMDKELAQIDRLNLIGEMAAGIAHEIRNPMTTVRGFLQYAKSSKAVLKAANIDLMISELDRANQIITEFLSLAKNKNTNKSLNNLQKTIASMLPLINAEAMLNGKSVIPVIGEVPDFYYDDKEIRQLILNLVMNGLEAMEAGGIVTLSAYREGSDIVLAVADQGPGIAEEIRAKLGTPFFTTKDSGTGLGLAICYSIAARHQAVLDIESHESGTTIFVRFTV